MSFTSFAVNRAIKTPKVDSFSSYLFVGPHPDDIEIGAGATVAKLVAMGKKVSFLICMDGRYGKENFDKAISDEEMIRIRKKEALASARMLGVSDIRFLKLCDGHQYKEEDLLSGIATIINEVKPDIVFGPDPDEKNECHADHLTVGKAIKELVYFSHYPEIFAHYLYDKVNEGLLVQAVGFYMSGHPNRFCNVSKTMDVQRRAILTHSSQYPAGHPSTKALFTYLNIRSIGFAFGRFGMHYEGFRILPHQKMHCLPEAK